MTGRLATQIWRGGDGPPSGLARQHGRDQIEAGRPALAAAQAWKGVGFLLFASRSVVLLANQHASLHSHTAEQVEGPWLGQLLPSPKFWRRWCYFIPTPNEPIEKAFHDYPSQLLGRIGASLFVPRLYRVQH